ncbi:MAG: hypothetical protein ABIH28_02425 [archaeon]
MSVPPLKTLHLYPDINPKEYSCGNYSYEELKEKGEIYREKSKTLLSKLGLVGRVKELLIINLNSSKLNYEPEPDVIVSNDIRLKPYSVSSTLINSETNQGDSPNIQEDKEGISSHIERYITRNMDFVALGVVHPSLADFVELLLKGTYYVDVHKFSKTPVEELVKGF